MQCMFSHSLSKVHLYHLVIGLGGVDTPWTRMGHEGGPISLTTTSQEEEDNSLINRCEKTIKCVN